MFPADNLALLQQAAVAANLRQAKRRDVFMGDTALSLWGHYYEAKSALADANPAFAAKLLPLTAPVAATVPGLPLIPTGVLYLADYTAPGTVTFTIDIAGPITLTVTPPSAPAFPVTPTAGATRQTATFPASADGLYALAVKVGAATIATVYVSVERGLFRKFRQISRYLKFAFTATRPTIPQEYKTLLALLYFLDAAAATGQTALYARLREKALALDPAPMPIALYP